MSRNSYFQFKQFRVIQEQSSMKVGMDGVLLGAWADVSDAEHILDVGTGTGLIALMMAQRNNHARIEAIEIESNAYSEALLNVRNSDWSERINIKECSFQEFSEAREKKFDLIVSNPPFFTNGIKAPHDGRSQARHSDSLPLSVLLSGAVELLSNKGKIALILPVESLQLLKQLAEIEGLFLSRLCHVKPNPQKPVFRIMAELTFLKTTIQEEQLMIEFENHHDYTPDYKALTKEFYLKF